MNGFLKALRYVVLSAISIYPTQACSSGIGVMQESGDTPPPNYRFFQGHLECIQIASEYLPRNPVIIDAGAFDGKESRLMARFWPNGKVHAFEPVKELYGKVLLNTKRIKNISCYNFALGSQDSEEIMYLSTEAYDLDHVSMSSSLNSPKEHLIYSGTIFKGTELVKVTTMDKWAEENKISKVDLLWLDMQGGELAAMKASPNIISKASVIVTELEFVEAYKDQPLYQEVKEWLENEGFVLVAGNFKFPKDKDQWFSDGIFVRHQLLKKK